MVVQVEEGLKKREPNNKEKASQYFIFYYDKKPNFDISVTMFKIAFLYYIELSYI